MGRKEGGGGKGRSRGVKEVMGGGWRGGRQIIADRSGGCAAHRARVDQVVGVELAVGAEHIVLLVLALSLHAHLDLPARRTHHDASDGVCVVYVHVHVHVQVHAHVHAHVTCACASACLPTASTTPY